MMTKTYLDRLALVTVLSACAGCAQAPQADTRAPVLASSSQALSVSGVSEDPAANSPDWPSAAHDWSNTGNAPAETQISPLTVAGLTVSWQHRFELTPGTGVPVMASAVIAGGTAYIVDVAGYAHARNLSDGTLLWSSSVSSSPPDPVFRAVVMGTPVVTDDALFVGDSGANISRVNRQTGVLEWSKKVDANPQASIQGDLNVAGPFVIAGVSSFENEDELGDLTMRGSVVALEQDDGALGFQLFTTSDQSAANPRFGAGVGVWSGAAIDFWKNRLYVGTGQFYEPGSATHACGNTEQDLSDSLLGISLCDGQLVNSRQFTSGDVFGLQYPNGKDFDVATPPNLFDIPGKKGKTIPVIGVGDKEGTYYVMDRRSLKVLWSRHVALGSVLGGFQGAAAYGKGLIYVAAHERNDGTSLNTAIPPGQAATFLNSRDGYLTMQLGARTNIMALDAATGAVRWSVTTQGAATFAPLLLANGVLFHGDANGALRAFDAQTGAQLFQTQIGGESDDAGGFLAGNLITGLSLSQGRLLVSSLPLAAGSPAGVTAYGLQN